MMKYLLKLKIHYNFIFLFILFSKVKAQKSDNKINYEKIGETSTKYLNAKKGTTLYFTSELDTQLLLVHFFPIDCEINIEGMDKKTNKYIKNSMKISNYNYYSFFVLFQKYSNFTITPLISQNELNQNRNYHLIINTIKFQNSKIPELKIKEKEPVFLYFNEILKNITLNYSANNNEYPIIVSFFIKEKIKFKIKITDNEKTIKERNINYKENIIIKPENPNANYTIFIFQDEKQIKHSTMIVQISQNNTTPFYLRKNQLNLGFIPKIFDYNYFYMEVFKGEEGEIMLFNKRQNGILISKIIPKIDLIPKIKEFPSKDINLNNNLSFYIYNQKLSFNSTHTQMCDNGCFLLITYYSNISKSLELDGTEFSILSRIWDAEEFSSQIINIPLNEYIFGFFDETNVNIHYYSAFIPYVTENIYIEIHGMNILGFSKEGIVKINTYKTTDKTKKLFDECKNKMIIKLNKTDIGLNYFNGSYISFAFEEDNDFDLNSNYYFRILRESPKINYTIYPLDTNKENYCETKNNKCYFLLSNEYNDLSNKIIIYGYGKNDTSYKISYMNDTDYNSINLTISNLQGTNYIGNFNGSLNLDFKKNETYALLEIESKENENLTVMTNVDDENNPSSINIYSYQLYHLLEGKSQKFSFLYPFINYRILINNTEGEGKICLKENCEKNDIFIHLAEHKIYSFSISDKKTFYIYAKSNLLYNIKIIKEISNEEIKELNYQYNYQILDTNEDNFPLVYFIKDVKYNGVTINFNFKYNTSNNINNVCHNLTIIGYSLDYSIISTNRFKNYYTMFDFLNETKGKYDNITNTGTIELSNELIQTQYKSKYKYLEDKYLMIIIKNNNLSDIENFRNNIYVFSKDINSILLPINKYIRNSFNLLENRAITQKYFFEKENITSDKFILEFSSNYEDKNIELTFSNLTNYNAPNKIGGFKQYILSINSKNSDDYYFNVTIKPTNKLNEENNLKEVNIIIKYYNEGKKENTDYICNKDINLEKINSKGKIINYKLIINNMYEMNKSSNNLNYICYLLLIKKKNKLDNEDLNTIAQITSKSLYIDKLDITEPSKEFYFNLNNLQVDEDYIASIFIKIENVNEGEEKYYSITYDINKKEDRLLIIVISISIAVFIIALIIFLLYYFKLKAKNNSLQDRVNAISFSDEISDDLDNKKEPRKSSQEYENTFI